jgi:hypothetical protein
VATPLYDYNQMMYRLDVSAIPLLFARDLPGDFDHNGFVDGQDLVIWQQSYGDTENAIADADGDGDSDGRDFLVWQRLHRPTLASAHSVPEPAIAWLVPSLMLLAGMALRRRNPFRFSAMIA